VTLPLYNDGITNDGEVTRMSKNKIRAGLLWSAMVAAMILSSGIAAAAPSLG
jgi:hypothetical protein